MKKFILNIALLMLLAGADAKQLEVLFVGNSYTYVSNMPETVKQMAEAKGHELVLNNRRRAAAVFNSIGKRE